MQYAMIAREVMRAMRGRRSQKAASRRLGYCANVAYVWEAGRRAPPASAFFRLGSANGAARERIVEFAASSPRAGTNEAAPQRARISGARAGAGQRPWTSNDTTAFLSTLAAKMRHSELSRAVGVDRTTLSRWLRGATEPRLPEL